MIIAIKMTSSFSLFSLVFITVFIISLPCDAIIEFSVISVIVSQLVFENLCSFGS